MTELNYYGITKYWKKATSTAKEELESCLVRKEQPIFISDIYYRDIIKFFQFNWEPVLDGKKIIGIKYL
jgi:hypothetical protein